MVKEKNIRKSYDCAVVGAGPAGLTAALYLRRAGAEVIVFEKESVGGQMASTPRIENFPGSASVSGIELADRLYEQVTTLGAKVAFDTVTNIIENADKSFAVATEYGGEYSASAVILATGASHRRLGLDREDSLTGRGVSYCAVCDGALYSGKTVAVAGGANSALTEALYLADLCERVYIVYRGERFRAEDALVKAVEARRNVEPIFTSEIVELRGEESLNAVKIKSKSGGEREIAVDCLFVSVGMIAANAPFAALAELTADGYIKAGEDCRASRGGVFVCGDCREKNVRQIATAIGDGASAAIAAAEYLKRRATL